MSSHFIKTLFVILLQAFWSLGAAAEPARAPFPENTRYATIGDSITHNGLYALYTQLFYLTRFPQDIEIINVGIAGDSVGGCLKRFEWDVIPARAGIVSIMFGMNDVRRELYEPGKAANDLPEARQRQITSYDSNLRNLVSRCKERGMQVILFTPSIYDDTSTMQSPNLPGVNGALEECAKKVQEIGKQFNAPVVDLYYPMRRLNEQEQAKNPAFTLIGKDRVHPQEPGNLVMAYLFLKAQNSPSEVARVVIDAPRGAVLDALHCEVDQVQVGLGTLKYRYKAQALPFPVEDRAKAALEWVRFTEDLNRETLKVTGLAAGSYRLEMDGLPIRNFTSDELAKGINLATEQNTPQYKQAQQVRALLRQRLDVILKLRDIACVEFRVGRDLPRPLALEQVQPLIENHLKTIVGSPSENYYRRTSEAYFQNKPLEADLVAQAEAMRPKIREAAQPHSHQVSLVLIQR